MLKIMDIIKYTLSIFLLLIFSCSSNKQDLNFIYLNYYNIASKISYFEGAIRFENIKTKVVDTYDVQYDIENGCKIVKFKYGKEIIKYNINNNQIIIYIEGKQPIKYKDTNENRMKSAIPINLGIDPYHFLETDLANTNVEKLSENILEVKYLKKLDKLKQQIKIENNKIIEIMGYYNDKQVYDVIYYKYIKISKYVYFPIEYVVKNEKNSDLDYKVTYKINKIGFI